MDTGAFHNLLSPTRYDFHTILSLTLLTVTIVHNERFHSLRCWQTKRRGGDCFRSECVCASDVGTTAAAERADNEGRGRSVSDSTGYGIQVAQSFRSVPSSADSWLLLLDRENLFLGKCVSFHKIIYWMYTICINKSN